MKPRPHPHESVPRNTDGRCPARVASGGPCCGHVVAGLCGSHQRAAVLACWWGCRIRSIAERFHVADVLVEDALRMTLNRQRFRRPRQRKPPSLYQDL